MDYKIKDYQTRMPREPNTQYVLSLSYGKDSLACLEAIRILGLPLDRIVHAEVWATDTIPADLPPMVEFKKKADKIILERYGIVVEHICAVERERERPLSFERQFYSIRNNKRIGGECIYGFPMVRGPWCNSKLKLAALERIEKIDFRETLLSRPQAASNGEREREREYNRGIPKQMALALQQTQIPNDTGFDTVSRDGRCHSVSLNSKETSSTDIYGFPVSVNRGNWCTRLKQRVFLLPL